MDREFEKDGELSMGSAVSDKPIQIISDNEMILNTYLFEDGDGLSVFDNQYYEENPEALDQYDYVCLLKCQLSTEIINASQIDL